MGNSRKKMRCVRIIIKKLGLEIALEIKPRMGNAGWMIDCRGWQEGIELVHYGQRSNLLVSP